MLGSQGQCPAHSRHSINIEEMNAWNDSPGLCIKHAWGLDRDMLEINARHGWTSK